MVKGFEEHIAKYDKEAKKAGMEIHDYDLYLSNKKGRDLLWVLIAVMYFFIGMFLGAMIISSFLGIL